MAVESMPGRASDAGPESVPMDRSDLLFELSWAADQARKAENRGNARDVKRYIEDAEEFLRRVKAML